MLSKSGNVTRWPLPGNVANDVDEPAWLVRTADGVLFLFNASGRIARFTPTPGKPDPFHLDAVFTDGVPAWTHINRAWIDPAGRINVIHERVHLTVIFPTGQVPPALTDTVLPKDLHRSGE
jgi:hypothetical protein